MYVFARASRAMPKKTTFSNALCRTIDSVAVDERPSPPNEPPTGFLSWNDRPSIFTRFRFATVVYVYDVRQRMCACARLKWRRMDNENSKSNWTENALKVDFDFSTRSPVVNAQLPPTIIDQPVRARRWLYRRSWPNSRRLCRMRRTLRAQKTITVAFVLVF